MTLPNYNAISFHSEEEHQAALYDACLLIVNTYNQTDMLDGYDDGVTSYDFMKFARRILNNLSINPND
jgi:tagatose-1,6-bisphosphate aldolase non-catalytic subunit AgaZ/GatZ